MASELMDIRVVGVGGAGINVLDRLVLDGARSESLVALHADLRSLNGSVAPHKIQLGRRTTRGLGSGGDPELGRVAAEEALAEFKEAIAGAELVFLCVGLGGGTGSGGAPLFARAAKAQGANVLVFATLPFSFEGSRRARQAHDAWRALRDEADAVICFENDRMGENLSPEASIHEAFADADRTISQSILSIGSMVSHESLIQLGFDEVLAALKGDEGRCIFGFGSAAGESRAHDALALALRNPLMDRGRMLEES